MANSKIYLGSTNIGSLFQGADDISIYLGDEKVYPLGEPTFQGKWKATYQDSHVESAECDSSSAITEGEINKTNLVSVEIGDCVTSIGMDAFSYCGSLTSIDIPNSVTSIGEGTFFNCRSLTRLNSDVDGVFNIPSGVTSIGFAAFDNCRSLTSVTVNATTPPTLDGGGFEDTNNCPIYVPCESVEAYKSASGWSRYADRIQCIQPPFEGKWKATLNNGTIQSGACTTNTTLYSYELPINGVVKLEVGDCVSEINSNLYTEKNSLTSATISDSVTKVGVRTFNACTNLRTVEVGSGVTSIGDWFVNGCTSLQSVKITATTPPRLGTACFTNSNNCPIYVPSSSVNTYKTTSGWSTYASRIQAIP